MNGRELVMKARTNRTSLKFLPGFMNIIIFCLLSLAPLCAQTAPKGQAKTWPPRVQPAWINDGLVMVGTWEPLQWVYRKNWQNWGNALAGKEAEAVFREERSEQTVIALKKL